MYATKTNSDLPGRTVGEHSFKELTKFADKDKWNNRFLQEYKGGIKPSIQMFSKNSRFIVICCNGQELGYARITNYSDLYEEVYGNEVWSISEIFVKPEFRHQGVMRRIIKHLINFYKVKSIYIEIGRYLNNLEYYKSLGFCGGVIDQGGPLCWLFLKDFSSVLSKVYKKNYQKIEEIRRPIVSFF